jgi:hypothetical protein
MEMKTSFAGVGMLAICLAGASVFGHYFETLKADGVFSHGERRRALPKPEARMERPASNALNTSI